MASRIWKRSIPAEFVRFSAIGTIGFLVDATVLYLMITGGGLGLYGARLLSYLAAATTTWFLNRHFTFHGGSSANARRQWGRFLLVNGLGGGINYGVYAALVAGSDIFANFPIAAVAIGSLAGLLFNFTASRQFVFRS